MASSDTGQFIGTINPALPAASEKLSDGDDAIRQTKLAVQQTLPNLGEAVLITDDKFNSLDNNTYSDNSQIILGIGAKSDNVANASLTCTTAEVNCNAKKLTNVSPTVSAGTDVGNRDYNDARYYQRDEIDAIIAATRNASWPVGSIYENGSTSQNPATLLGFGTWALYGTGRVTVSLDSGQSEFNSLGETGGAKTVGLSTSNMPNHAHTVPAHNHSMNMTFGTSGDGLPATSGGGSGSLKYVATQPATATSSAGSGTAHQNLQPYIVVYRWRRTS